MTRRPPALPTARRTPAVLAAVLTLCLAAAGCGSNLSPDTVAGVASGGGTISQDGGVTGDDTTQAGADTGSDTGTSGGPTNTDAGGAPTGTDTSGGTGPSTDTGGGTDPGGSSPTNEKGSCDGFKNQTGVTDSTITIANVSDISGPVPGVFQAAQDATRAYAEYFNASSDLCGRKLSVDMLDSRADSGANQVAYARACDEAFAAVGSMSVFDNGGASTTQQCGLPDLHAVAVSKAVYDCTSCFGAAAINPTLQLGSMARYVLDAYGEDAQHTALLYVNVADVADAANSLVESWTKAGVGMDYVQTIDVAEFNYAPYVQQLKDRGIKVVHYIGPYQFTVRLQQAMAQQDYEPTAFIQDQTIYDQRYVDEAGDAGNGTVVYVSTARFDDTSNKEMQLYQQWLQQVRPGATPSIYGVYAWSATRLFVEQAVALGGRLTRETLIEALRKVRGWTGNQIHSPQEVGTKVTGKCTRVVQLEAGRWKQISPGDYLCTPLISTG